MSEVGVLFIPYPSLFQKSTAHTVKQELCPEIKILYSNMSRQRADVELQEATIWRGEPYDSKLYGTGSVLWDLSNLASKTAK
jgi:hypothetical protein